MATRAAMLSPAHVEALNAIPVEFYGTNGKLKAINEAWKLYLDHHDTRGPPSEAWAIKRLDLFMDLLHLLSQYLGYTFSKAQLKRDIYSPAAHETLETEQTQIRNGLAKLLNGEAALPMIVKEFPATANAEALENSAEIQRLLIAVLKGERALRTEGPSDQA